MNPTTAAVKVDQTEVNEYVREYLRYAGFSNTLEIFDSEIKTKAVSSKLARANAAQRNEEEPRIYSFFKPDQTKTRRELNLEKDHKDFQKKYNMILQAARQIFSVSVNCLQLLHSMKEVNMMQLCV
jgi:hypothetical protein